MTLRWVRALQILFNVMGTKTKETVGRSVDDAEGYSVDWRDIVELKYCLQLGSGNLLWTQRKPALAKLHVKDEVKPKRRMMPTFEGEHVKNDNVQIPDWWWRVAKDSFLDDSRHSAFEDSLS